MAWINTELARLFEEIAALLRLDGEDSYRVRAYERSASAIGGATTDLGRLSRSELTEVRGIGEATADKILEHRRTGEIAMLTSLRERVPPALLELTRVPGLGPKMGRRLHDELGVESLEDLRAALEAGHVGRLAGAGPKTAEKLRAGLERLGAKDTDRTPAADVLDTAEEICARLREVEGVVHVAYAGSLRRMRDTVGDVDVLAAAEDPEAVTEALRGAGQLVERVIGSGSAKTSVVVRGSGLQIDLRVVEPAVWGAALLYFTGSSAHNVRLRERAVKRGLSLSEYGLHTDGRRVAGATEEQVYAALGLQPIPPPMREDSGEVEAAARGALPRVVTLDDIRGDLHGHSDYSGDGKASLEAMVAGAAERGWQYWAATDHAENLTINGVSRADLLERRRLLAGLEDRYQIRVLDGLELNIGIDGSVDYDDDFLASFDFCVASVHSLLQRSEPDQTRRICTAMRHPSVHAIGHPTGRKIGLRPGYDIALDTVLETAVATGTALEINASPRRLDLSGEMVRQAVEAGVTLTISTDAHRVGELDLMRYGVATAQRGWATPADVLSCRDLDGLTAFLEA